MLARFLYALLFLVTTAGSLLTSSIPASAVYYPTNPWDPKPNPRPPYPSPTIPPLVVFPEVNVPITPIYQNQTGQADPEMRAGSGVRISENGCTLCCYTMLINSQLAQLDVHIKKPDGTQGPLLQYSVTQTDGFLDTGLKNKNGEIVPGYSVKDNKEVMNMGVLWQNVIADIKSKSGVDLKNRLMVNQWQIPDGGAISYSDAVYLWSLFGISNTPIVVRVNNNTHSVLVNSFHPVDPGDTITPVVANFGSFDIIDPWLNDPKDTGSSERWLTTAYSSNVNWLSAVTFTPEDSLFPFETPNPEYIASGDLYDLEKNPNKYGFQDLLPYASAVPEPGTLLGFGIPILMIVLGKLRQQRE